MELKDYVAILKRRMPWFVGTLVVFAISFSYLYVREQVNYSASAQVILRSEAPDYLRSQQYTLPPRNSRLTSTGRRQMLKSRATLRVAARIYQANFVSGIEDPRHWVTSEADAIRMLQAHGDPLGKVEDVVACEALASFLNGTVAMSADPASDVIDFSAVCNSPLKALLSVHAVAAAGIDYSRLLAQADLRLMREGVAKRREECDGKLTAEMGDLRSNYLFLEQSFQTKNLALQESIRQEDEARRGIEGREKQFALLMRQMHGAAAVPGSVPAISTLSPYIDSIRQEITHLRGELGAMGESLQPNHPDIRSRQARLIRLQEDLDGAHLEAGNADLVRLQHELADLREVLKIATAREETLKQDLRQIQEGELDYRRLKQEIEHNDRGLQAADEDLRRIDAGLQVTQGFVEPYEWPTAASVNGRQSEHLVPFWVMLSLVMALGVAYMRQYFDTAVLSEYDIRRHLNLPVLAVVPFEHREKILLTDLAMRHPLAEVFNTAATLIRSAMNEASFRSFLVGSAIAKEGKTSISVNLAIAMARKGLRVILVDGDLRIPTIHGVFHLENKRGLSTLLEGRLARMTELGEGAMPDWKGSGDFDYRTYLQPTGVENLRVITSGPSPVSTVRLLESRAMRELLAEVEDECDFLIFDTAPICTVGDTLMLATLVDACILVVGSGLAEQRDISWTKHLLDNVSASVLGVILNRATHGKGSEYYYYYSEDRKKVRNR